VKLMLLFCLSCMAAGVIYRHHPQDRPGILAVACLVIGTCAGYYFFRQV
jgi:hypothetical protein